MHSVDGMNKRVYGLGVGSSPSGPCKDVHKLKFKRKIPTILFSYNFISMLSATWHETYFKYKNIYFLVLLKVFQIFHLTPGKVFFFFFNHSNSLLQPQSVLTTCTVGQRATTRHSLHAFPDVVHGQPYLPAKSGLTNFSAHLTGLTF